jgi:DNA-binding CsgD family transcriptional regulator
MAGLLERTDVLAAIGDAVAAAHAGSGNALFVTGEPGLGKTAVLARAVELAGRDMQVAAGRAEPMEQGVRSALAGEVVRALGGDDSVDPTAQGTPVAEHAAPVYGVLRWLQRREAPALIALDDLHWADDDSLRLFLFLARRLRDLPVSIVATLRPWPDAALEGVRGLVAAGEAELERLAPLSAPGVAELLAARSGLAVPAETAAAAVELSGGAPLLVEQLALVLARGEQLPDPQALAGVSETLLLTRFAGLDAGGIACVRAGSVLGTRFRPELACEVAEIEHAALDATLHALTASGLLQEDEGGTVRFAHPLFAQALYEDTAPPLRRRLHARAFRLLAARGLEAEASAHAIAADLRGDREAIEVLARVGHEALTAGAVATAARTLDGAVALSGDRPEPRLLLWLCEALIGCGHAERAAAACERLLALPTLTAELRIAGLRAQGRVYYLLGAPDHGEEALSAAARLAIEQAGDAAVECLLDLSLALWLSAGPGRALPAAAEARELARAGDAHLRESADATWGHIALEAGDPEGAVATAAIEAALAGPRAARLLDPAELAWPWAAVYHLPMNLKYLDRHADAEAIFRRARDIVEDAGAATASATVAIHIAHAAMRSGRLADALEESERAQEFAELTPSALPYARIVRAEALAWLGRLEESERECAAVATEQWFARLWLAHVRGMLLLWRGDATASDVLLAAERITRDAGVREPCHMHWWSHAITAHLAAGRTDRAQATLAFAEKCAEPLRCCWPRIVVARGRAELHAEAGEDAEAEAQFERLLALHGEVDFPLQLVEAELAYGGYLRRRGSRAAARPHLAGALALAEQVGAAGLARQARDELALAGGRRRRASPVDRDVLTAAEERVAQLAAAGLGNAEIARRLSVSINTVETHLKRVYAKLEIRSRRELMTRSRAA